MQDLINKYENKQKSEQDPLGPRVRHEMKSPCRRGFGNDVTKETELKLLEPFKEIVTGLFTIKFSPTSTLAGKEPLSSHDRHPGTQESTSQFDAIKM
ncbi:hypothetical protein CDAR_501641 [Caerostris darwini]|uniref:Uncharacterized protein n=1 Tax=Caerostris darwini TaxID=1538125 RepID=A0AAV4PY84_9ARAC|nr:hypothetical protein CDAR_501641 [Caerostris darwini]